MTAVDSLECPHCGADLDVPDGVSILKCRYCGSKLQLRETGSVRALALIERGLTAIGDNTARTAEGVERLHNLTANQRTEAFSRWRAKLHQLEVLEAGFRGRARTLHKWMVLLLLAWLPVTAGVGYGLSLVLNKQSPVLLMIPSALFFGFPIAAILVSNRTSVIAAEAEEAAAETKAWRQREPL
jgi:hypothetical protein